MGSIPAGDTKKGRCHVKRHKKTMRYEDTQKTMRYEEIGYGKVYEYEKGTKTGLIISVILVVLGLGFMTYNIVDLFINPPVKVPPLIRAFGSFANGLCFWSS